MVNCLSLEFTRCIQNYYVLLCFALFIYINVQKIHKLLLVKMYISKWFFFWKESDLHSLANTTKHVLDEKITTTFWLAISWIAYVHDRQGHYMSKWFQLWSGMFREIKMYKTKTRNSAYFLFLKKIFLKPQKF